MYQKITILGNLGRDPEMRFLPNGTAVTNLSVATNRTYTKNEQKVEETCWFRVSVWGNQAEACNTYLNQGSRVLIEGRMNPDPDTGGPKVWTREDGTPSASFEITAERVIFASSKNEAQPQSRPATSNDDVPF